MNPVLRGDALVLDLGAAHRSLSSAVLGGGLGWVRTWMNLQVERGYDCHDPEGDLRRAATGLEAPVVGMLTAAPVARFTTGAHGCAKAVVTVGLSHPLAAAGTAPGPVPSGGTINLLVFLAEPLADAGLVNALQTAVEAKAQALAAATIPALNGDCFATGTATDSICIACPPGGRETFAGPATTHGGDVARAVYQAVMVGATARPQARERDPPGRGAGENQSRAGGSRRWWVGVVVRPHAKRVKTPPSSSRPFSIIVASGLGGELWHAPARSPARVRTSAQGARRRRS